VLILFTATIFLGALLLFLVQPMAGRMLLPSLGGAPAVWNTAMVFYQAALLAGYAYAHFATRWLGVKRQAGLHLVVLLAPLLVLPIGLPHGWTPPATTNPVWWLLTVLAVSVGPPFFVVAATSPLLQRWFATSEHRWAADPYFLYAASNLGSLLALVSYPVLIEPRLRLAEQSWCWAAGYAALVVLTASCALWTRHVARNVSNTGADTTKGDGVRITARRRLRWVLLAFVPCSLMLSVTTYITSEIAPIPLLWVIPLGIYLLTFILVFARRRVVPHIWMVRALPFVVLALAATMGRFKPIDVLIVLHLAGLFVVAMVCHGEIANDRPSARHLTEFYLWMSAGGVLGGIFNALLAPLIFSSVLEYPLTLALACLLMPRRGAASPSRRAHVLDIVLPITLGLFTTIFILYLCIGPPGNILLTQALMFGVPPVLCFGFVRRPLRFALGLMAIMMATAWAAGDRARTLHVARGFFGSHRVTIDSAWQHHVLFHGNTLHGLQSRDASRRRQPLSYYARSGPLGQTITALPNELRQCVAAVGLGAGTVACYGERGERWTFYEIDPVVERIARNPRYFTFLKDCPANVEVVLGDARLSLCAAADGQFGLIILDAYSSDSIPLHLITREALALYLQKLAPRGVIAFHITNRHLDLEPVLANLAQDAGLFALHQRDSDISVAEYRQGKRPSHWVVMTRQPSSLAGLTTDPRWQPPCQRADVGVWTDDYASLFRVWSWR
jgi:hypothetical protein